MIEDFLIHNKIYQNLILEFSISNKINKQSGEKIVGFGNTKGFYLYWIRKDKDDFYFSSRRKFNKELKDNRVSYELKEENKTLILNAMQSIYKAFKSNDTVIIKQNFNPKVVTENQKIDTQNQFEKILTQLFVLNDKLTKISERLLKIESKLSTPVQEETLNKQIQTNIGTSQNIPKINEEKLHQVRESLAPKEKTHFYDHRYTGLPKEQDIRGKIRCTFCGNVFLDTLDECPYCKASCTEIFKKGL
jgi:rubrerythrin